MFHESFFPCVEMARRMVSSEFLICSLTNFTDLLEACSSKKGEQNDDGGGTGLEMDSVENDIEMFSEQDSNESYEEIDEKDEGGCSLKLSRSMKTSVIFLNFLCCNNWR